MDNKKRLGRPPLPEDQKQKYQRVALYPETHAEAKKLSEKDGEKLIDWFHHVVSAIKSGRVVVKDEQGNVIEAKRKKFSLFK